MDNRNEIKQIQMEAVEWVKTVDDIWKDLERKHFNTQLETKIGCGIRFFAKNIQACGEFNEIILKLADCFTVALDLKLVKWSVRDINAMLMMITSLLLKRKDEVIIRKAASTFKKCIEQLDRDRKDDITTIIQLHTKAVELLLHKMSKVSTFYTQLKVLNLLNLILKHFEDGGFDVIRNYKIFASCSGTVIHDAMEMFKAIDEKYCFETSRPFLEIFNQHNLPSPFIYSFNGFVMDINNSSLPLQQEVTIDFNLRQLSISFFIEISEQTFCLEMEDCEAFAEKNKFINPNHIELKLEPAHFHFLNESDEVVHVFDQLDAVVLVITDQDVFFSIIYPILKTKTSLAADMTDQESMFSYHTIKSVISEHKQNEQSKPIVTLDNIKQTVDSPKNVSESIVQIDLSTSNFENNTQETRKTRQTAKVGPTLKHTTIYDEIPSDDDPLPPAKQYFQQCRINRKNQRQGIDINKKNETYLMSPEISTKKKVNEAKKVSIKKNIKTTTTKTVKNPTKPRGRTAADKKVSKRVKKSPKQQTLQKEKENQEPELQTFSDAEYRKNCEKIIAENRAKILRAIERHSTKSEQKKIFGDIAKNSRKRPLEETPENEVTQKQAITEEIYVDVVVEIIPNANKKLKPTLNDADTDIENFHQESRNFHKINENNADEQIVEKSQSTQQIIDSKRQKKVLFSDEITPEQETNKSTVKLYQTQIENSSLIAQNPSQSPRDEIIFNFETLKYNEILHKFINDSNNINNHQSENDNIVYDNNDGDDYDTLIKTKNSPSSTGDSLIQDVNICISNPKIVEDKPQDTKKLVRNKKEESLSLLYKKKAKEMLQPIWNEIKALKLNNSSNLINDSLKKEVSKGMQRKKELKDHLDHHVKLLKRLQHSKTELKQLTDKDVAESAALAVALQNVETEKRKKIKDVKMKLDALCKKASNINEEVKRRIWKKYVDKISADLQLMLQTSSKF
ncbi:CLUMA_CG013809, isoform A [Clunio marinus]|uniref:CLUMA_CG013809, isoform A n=1 Tax=Clunio marinus TaxID=568069 RepID=A0A1J1ILV5_9DIPT|nr:CLUMA_CG013809, isoform A [Clunio marinus]